MTHAHTVLIVQPLPGSETCAAIRAWLESDQRLGLRISTVPLERPFAGSVPAISLASEGNGSPAEVAIPSGNDRGDQSWTSDSRAMPATSSWNSAFVAAPATVLPLLRPESLGPARNLPPFCDQELSPADAAAALADLDQAHVRHCQSCGLASQRTQTVFGVGNPRAPLAFVGEGPGADEDAQGLPFVGKAGQLLTKMIAAMSLTRDQVYICNTVKCRPPGNRTPVEDEIAACLPYLLRQLAIVRPRVIVALGRPASQTLLASQAPISQLRGNWFAFPPAAANDLAALPPCDLMPTFHPSYLLRVPQEKAKAWSDLQLVMARLGLSRKPS